MSSIGAAPGKLQVPRGTNIPAQAAVTTGSARVVRFNVLSDMQTFMDNQNFVHQIIESSHTINVELDEKVPAHDLLLLIRYILKSSVQFVDRELLGRKVADESFEEPRILKDARSHEDGNRIPSSDVINRITCQITCKALGAKDAEEALREIFESVSSYSWTKKLVLILAAFAILYGDFWVVTSTKNIHALSLVMLKGFGAFDSRKHREYIESINDLVKQLMEVTTSLLKLDGYTTEYLEKEVPMLQTVYDHISVYICQTIIAVISVAAQFTSFTNYEERHWTWGLSELPKRVERILLHSKQLLNDCEMQIDEMVRYKNYTKNMRHPSDIVGLLRSLFIAFKPEDPPLFNNFTKEPVKLEYFRKKNVYLLISSWKVSEDDLRALINIYKHPRFLQRPSFEETGLIAIEGAVGAKVTPPYERPYDIIWIPALDPSYHKEEELIQLNEKVTFLSEKMPWIVAKNASAVHPLAVKYFREHWHFGREPMLVSLHYSGWVACLNAMPMIRLWGIDALPFTEWEIPELLKGRTSWLEIVVLPIIPKLQITVDEYILFTGGHQIKGTYPGIEKRISDAVGRLFKVVELHSPAYDYLNQFMARLEDHMYVKMQTCPLLPDGSVLEPMKYPDIKQMVETYTACERGGFAILTKGYNVLAVVLSTTAREVLGDHEKWLREVTRATPASDSTFENVFMERCKAMESPEGSCRVYYFPTLNGLTPRYMTCSSGSCYQLMRSDFKFHCCHD